MIAALLCLVLAFTPVASEVGSATWYGAYGTCVDGFKRTCTPYLRGERNIYAAVGSWKWGDKPYVVQVCAIKTGKCIYAIVRDFCLACKNGYGVIDLSPKLFRQLAPLGIGRIKVKVTKVVEGNR